MVVAVAFLNYALNKNLHVAALLLVIISLGVYAIFKFKLSEQSTGYKFNFIGEKLNTIDNNINGLVETVSDHSDKIIKLETVQSKWELKLAEKFEREEKESRSNAS